MKLREMQMDEMKMLMTLLMATEDQFKECYDKMKEKDGGWVLKAIEKREALLEIEIDMRTRAMILYLSDGAVGKCAKYVDDICIRATNKKIDIVMFSKQLYPHGVIKF